MCQPAHLAGADNAGPLPGSDDCGKAATLRQVQGKPALTSCLAVLPLGALHEALAVATRTRVARWQRR